MKFLENCKNFYKEWKHVIPSINSYFLDCTVYSCILVLCHLYNYNTQPKYQEFSLQDYTLMHSFIPEAKTMFPLKWLYLLSIGFPILQFLYFAIIPYYNLSKERKLWDLFSGLLSLLGAMSCQIIIITVMKNVCGLPRPDLIARCNPIIAEVSKSTSLISVEKCQTFLEKNLESFTQLKEGFRAFPSGHSSTIFCSMAISSLNIAGKTQAFDSRGMSIKMLLVVFPLFIACVVSFSRLSDNRHSLRDITVGGFIGATSALFYYTQYFPSIFLLENCGRAYPPRRFGVEKYFNNVGGFWNIKDSTPGSFNRRTIDGSEMAAMLTKSGVLDA